MSENAKPAPYTPPAELVAQAESAVATASDVEMRQARRLYEAYGRVTNGCSAVTGATLPDFAGCNALVQAGWLSAARAAAECSLADIAQGKPGCV